ncbi:MULTISPECIES: hypothetical protein [unclassified Aliivibrio]|jgi:hypothetical protein|uniref:hypothetical protein n=1 Tax=unclassified Aliivibrio TaxID=2645654 RepID=UPI00080E2685|nr:MULTISPECIES: hypothetical protein [unclassified Aliivibrio]OCH14747.1 hypothetical protein A6E05_03420 [Aliivibrio sp. 1S165]OCH25927.1 hypothetical protein A6E03_00505 [Aliivibrio sp. 1S128]OCH34853.1 hypothetical protein A6E06_15860 [Aliivibrio sp. 1S175]
MFKSILSITIVSALLILGLLWQHSSSQLNYLKRDMVWSWSWAYYEPFSNGIQTSRTNDTKQLIFRRVDTINKISTYVDVTYTNTFEIIVIHEQYCQPKAIIPTTVQLNDLPEQSANFVCEDNGKSYLLREVVKHLSTFKLQTLDFNLSEDFSNWPIEELKKDQFIQKHSNFFKDKGDDTVYEWSRD